MTTHLTIRNVPEEVAAALEAEKQRRGGSLNQTVINLLRQSLGVEGRRANGLARFSGTWTEDEEQEFLRNTVTFGEIDPDLWK